MWEQSRWIIVGGGLLVLLQALFVITLLIQRSRRLRAETALRESEERFRLMADSAPVLIWTADAEGRCTFANRPWLEFTGRTLEQELGFGWAQGVHPEDMDRCREIMENAVRLRQPFRYECRVRHVSGEYRWLLDLGVPRYQPDGSFAGYIGSCVDITEQKHNEDSLIESERLLRRLAGRLSAAEEEVRARIARDLHDDVNQRLAAASIALSELTRKAHTAPGDPQWPDELERVRDRIAGICDDIRHLSHDLHPGILKSMGLKPALEAHCRQLAKEHAVGITFAAPEDLSCVSPEAALCLFRVAQEGLRNVISHAHASRATVELVCDGSGSVELIVADDGQGFGDPQTLGRHDGLGLVSIKERVRLARGAVTIVTGPQQGTVLRVRVPAKATDDSVADSPRVTSRTLN